MMSQSETVQWSLDLDPDAWDRILAAIGGHPLQSALWGESRRRIDGVEDRRWAAFVAEKPVWVGRFEVRTLPLRGKVAWLPRGPVLMNHPLTASVHRKFLNMLKAEGHLICFMVPYPQLPHEDLGGLPVSDAPRTLWLDLKKGQEWLYDNMHKKLRYGVRAAQRAGVVVEKTTNPVDVAAFFQLCDQISESKQFDLPGSEELMQNLILLSTPESAYKAHLFVARFEGKVVAGYLSIENGTSLHNIWNGVDRSCARECPGEAVLWYQVAWAVDAGLSLYDQEGIDEENNPGCYKFKMRLGGEAVTLPGLRAYPYGVLGKTLLKLGRWMGKV